MEHRIPNVIYSEPPILRWKFLAFKAAVWVLALVVPFVFYILSKRFGDFNVFAGSILCLIVAFFAAIWSERRKRQLKRQRKVAERVG